MAGTVCTICSHTQRTEIEGELAKGVPLRAIARRYGTTHTTLGRHSRDCIPAAIADARSEVIVTSGKSILEQIQELNSETRVVLREAKNERRFSAYSLLASVALRNMELQAKLTGELNDRVQVNIVMHPDWAAFKEALLDALESHPGALESVRSVFARRLH